MKFSIVVFVIFSCGVVYGQWANRVYLEEAVHYFNMVIQETILRLEQQGFCNLKLTDRTETISQQMYKWLVEGNITYSNGYLVSIQKMDVTNVAQTTSSRDVDGVTQTLGSIHGLLNIRDMKIGYDVLAELGEDGDHRFTGTFVHTLAVLQFWILQNLHTHEISVSHTLSSFSGGLDRMAYMPANNLTQVISRTYTPSNAYDDVNRWGRDVMLPIILDIATNEIEYPRLCLDCR